MYISPIKRNIQIEDQECDSSDDDTKPITNVKSKYNKKVDKNDIIVISDNEVDECIPGKNSNYSCRTSNIISGSTSTSINNFQSNNLVEDNLLSINEFRLSMLNKLHLDYNTPEGSSVRINIRSRTSICDDLLHWINSVQVNDFIKNPIIYIEDEE